MLYNGFRIQRAPASASPSIDSAGYFSRSCSMTFCATSAYLEETSPMRASTKRARNKAVLQRSVPLRRMGLNVLLMPQDSRRSQSATRRKIAADDPGGCSEIPLVLRPFAASISRTSNVAISCKMSITSRAAFLRASAEVCSAGMFSGLAPVCGSMFNDECGCRYSGEQRARVLNVCVRRDHQRVAEPHIHVRFLGNNPSSTMVWTLDR
jgi:hypothetical protein